MKTTNGITIEKSSPGNYWLVRDGKTVGSIQREYINGYRGVWTEPGKTVWNFDLDDITEQFASFKEAKARLGK